MGHTRLPRYVRGKVGTIERDGDVEELQDTDIQGLGPKQQHVYTVRFAARELWGDQASPHDSVYGICGRAILNPPKPILQSAQMDLPRLPLDDGGPVFAEPWQATAFALAVRLSAEGHFTWKEWAATLADELKASRRAR